VEYDDNKDQCLRIDHAYSVQLMRDFPKSYSTPYLTFEACSGSLLVDMAQRRNQMSRLPKDVEMVTMQAGG